VPRATRALVLATVAALVAGCGEFKLNLPGDGAGGGGGGGGGGLGSVPLLVPQASPSAYVLGDVRLGTKAFGALMLRRGDAAPPDPGTLSFSTPDSFRFAFGSYPGMDGTCGRQLTATRCRVVFEYSPATEQGDGAEVQLDGATLTTVKGRGAASDGPLQLAGEPILDLGHVQIGSGQGTVIMIRNAGAGPVTPSLSASSYTSPAGQVELTSFWLTRDASTCVTGAPLAPGGMCSYAVSFEPKEPGDWGVSVQIGDASGGAPVHVLLLASSF
jgi:hypothetical protein